MTFTPQHCQTPLTSIKVQIYLNSRSDKTCLARNFRFAVLTCAKLLFRAFLHGFSLKLAVPEKDDFFHYYNGRGIGIKYRLGLEV